MGAEYDAAASDKSASALEYLEKTRPAFIRAVAKSRNLGVTATGVMAGPTRSVSKR